VRDAASCITATAEKGSRTAGRLTAQPMRVSLTKRLAQPVETLHVPNARKGESGADC
jgi:hypothetical protein